jgi:hypothetical protein
MLAGIREDESGNGRPVLDISKRQDGMRRPVSGGIAYATQDALKWCKGEPALKKHSNRRQTAMPDIDPGQKNLTVHGPRAAAVVFEAAPSVVALEAGGHSRWISKLLVECGHRVIVAHARELRLI